MLRVRLPDAQPVPVIRRRPDTLRQKGLDWRWAVHVRFLVLCRTTLFIDAFATQVQSLSFTVDRNPYEPVRRRFEQRNSVTCTAVQCAWIDDPSRIFPQIARLVRMSVTKVTNSLPQRPTVVRFVIPMRKDDVVLPDPDSSRRVINLDPKKSGIFSQPTPVVIAVAENHPHITPALKSGQRIQDRHATYVPQMQQHSSPLPDKQIHCFPRSLRVPVTVGDKPHYCPRRVGRALANIRRQINPHRLAQRFTLRLSDRFRHSRIPSGHAPAPRLEGQISRTPSTDTPSDFPANPARCTAYHILRPCARK